MIKMNVEKNSPIECFSWIDERIDLVSSWTILNDLDFWFFFYKNSFKKSFSQFMNFLISHGAFPSRQRTFLYRASDTHINVHVSRVDLLLTCCTTYTGYLPVPPHLSPFRSWCLPNSGSWKDIEPRGSVRLIRSIKDKRGKSFAISFACNLSFSILIYLV